MIRNRYNPVTYGQRLRAAYRKYRKMYPATIAYEYATREVKP